MVSADTARGVFIGCDWGSTSFRLRVVERGSRRVLAEQRAATGIKAFAALAPAERAAAMADFLSRRLAEWPGLPATVPTIVSGMASSSVGWRELPYAVTPFPLDGSGCGQERMRFAGPDGRQRDAWLISGVRTQDDVMRGEECALIGAHLLQAAGVRPGGTTVALLAGTHPKHAMLRAGVLLSFRTHLTGELFDLLTRESLLAASVDRAVAAAPPELGSFRAGVRAAAERGIGGALFQVRARDVLAGANKPANTWFLSGVLVGGELERVAASLRDAELWLIGDALRVTLYREALSELGLGDQGRRAAEIDLGTAVMAGQELLLDRAQRSPQRKDPP